MSRTWMIYGANGYTGRLAARVATHRGLKPVLAGRHAGPIRSLADDLGCESRVFELHDPAVVATNLQGVAAVLHCAGPFSATSRPMLDGCLRAGTHYLDITGEIAVFEHIHSRGREIRDAGIIAIPGVGFDVVPTDCLAAMLKRELPSATHLKLAFMARDGKLSPGTAKTLVEGLPEGGRVRENGRVVNCRVTAPAWVHCRLVCSAISPLTMVLMLAPKSNCAPPAVKKPARMSASSLSLTGRGSG